MPEVADAFRRFAGGYVAAHAAAMLPSHRRAIADIIACRTEALGGQQWCCNHCGALLHVFHSCRNRACPKCHAEQTQAWLEQRREMLPVPPAFAGAGSISTSPSGYPRNCGPRCAAIRSTATAR